MFSLLINFMAWLGITMSPVELPWDAAEAWQLGFQDAATQGTDIFLFLLYIVFVILFSLFLHFRRAMTEVLIFLFILVIVSVYWPNLSFRITFG